MRRLRATEAMRSLVRETQVTRNDLVYPMFVVEGKRVRREIGSMPGNYQLSVDELVAEAARAYLAGVPAVILFGIPAQKDPLGSGAYQDNGIIPRAVAALKDAMPQLIVMTDICLCEYTSHGHCGVVSEDRILNDPSLELLAHSAVAHARAGADVVAPSDMMDGRVKAIRSALDGEGYEDVPVLAYSAKFASGFYGPFREAAESTPQFGDRRSYQMDPANRREALREVLLDVQEGADMVMVKPGLPYLDLVREVRDLVDMPVAVYNVSGEFAMVKAAAANGWIDERRVVLEILTGFKRAGASFILTYHAPDAARWLAEDASHKVKVKKTVGRR
ncbi:MAG: porphobilinogen synthase [Armatimonadetes bacterium]|nr:porphobilinogen synthase [Armatimonadota bacterium]